jgi:iron complex transport system ATP-binding protein
MLEARGLTHAIGGRKLVDDVDLAIAPGRVKVLIGPNGPGKSMLLRLFSGELRPTGGQVLLDGRSIAALSAAQLGSRRAVVPQSSVLAFAFTVLEVAMLGATVPGFQLASDTARRAGLEAIGSVGLTEFKSQNYPHLSDGERQRVHIARALCQLATGRSQAGETRCFLLDEPTSSLDLAHQSLVLQAIRREAQEVAPSSPS